MQRVNSSDLWVIVEFNPEQFQLLIDSHLFQSLDVVENRLINCSQKLVPKYKLLQVKAVLFSIEVKVQGEIWTYKTRDFVRSRWPQDFFWLLDNFSPVTLVKMTTFWPLMNFPLSPTFAKYDAYFKTFWNPWKHM